MVVVVVVLEVLDRLATEPTVIAITTIGIIPLIVSWRQRSDRGSNHGSAICSLCLCAPEMAPTSGDNCSIIIAA